MSRLRLLALLTGVGVLVVFDLTTGSPALLRWYCGPTYLGAGYAASCRVERGSITRMLRALHASDVMSGKVVTISPKATVIEAAKLMLARPAGRSGE